MWLPLELFGKLTPIGSRYQQVQYDEVRQPLPQESLGCSAVGGNLYPVPLLGEELLQNEQDILVIIHQENGFWMTQISTPFGALL